MNKNDKIKAVSDFLNEQNPIYINVNVSKFSNIEKALYVAVILKIHEKQINNDHSFTINEKSVKYLLAENDPKKLKRFKKFWIKNDLFKEVDDEKIIFNTKTYHDICNTGKE